MEAAGCGSVGSLRVQGELVGAHFGPALGFIGAGRPDAPIDTNGFVTVEGPYTQKPATHTACAARGIARPLGDG